MKNGRIVNLNPNAQGWRKMLRTATEAGNGTKEPQARAKEAKKGGCKSSDREPVVSSRFALLIVEKNERTGK
jgi:hypothetical protein